MNNVLKIDVTVANHGELFDFVLMLAGVPRKGDTLGIRWNNKRDEDPTYFTVAKVTWLDDIIHVYAEDTRA